VCGTKNFASVRSYSAPQLHRTIVAIPGICAYGTPKQVETATTIKLIHYRRLGAKPLIVAVRSHRGLFSALSGI
jgi:hypothetical protein